MPKDEHRCCAPFSSGYQFPQSGCLDDRPGATVSFTGNEAQPKTGTTPAPPKATVNDDYATSTWGT